jgi:hypothetical protein
MKGFLKNCSITHIASWWFRGSSEPDSFSAAAME